MIKKIKQQMIIHDNLLISLILVIFVLGDVFIAPVWVSDELWNFQNVFKMYNGFVIYKDANVIITPLFHIIGNLLFHVLGANFFVFRIYNIMLFVTLLLSIYILLKKLFVSKGKSVCYLFIVYAIYECLIPTGANYNILAMIFVIWGIILEIINNKRGMDMTRDHILQGICIFLIFMTKQNIAFFYLLGLISYKLIQRKENIVKTIFTYGVVNIILAMPFIIMSILQNNFREFIDIAILGIGEFAKENFHMNYINLCIIIALVLLIIITIYILFKKKEVNLDTEQRSYIKILTCFAIPMLFASYPIFNTWHVIYSILLILLLILYSLEILILRHVIDKNNVKKIKKLLVSAAILFIIFINLRYINTFNEPIYMYRNYNEPYFGAILYKRMKEHIDIMTDYIQNSDNRVIVFSDVAALYMVPLRQSNGTMDLPFLGNMGKDGENRMIEKISALRNITILIKKGEKSFQESEKILNYIKSNFKQVGEMEGFLIYETMSDEDVSIL